MISYGTFHILDIFTIFLCVKVERWCSAKWCFWNCKLSFHTFFVKLLNGCDKTQLYSRWYLTLRFMFFYYYSSETLLCCFSSCSVSNFHIRFLARKMFYIWIKLPNLRHCIIFHHIAIYFNLDNFSN